MDNLSGWLDRVYVKRKEKRNTTTLLVEVISILYKLFAKFLYKTKAQIFTLYKYTKHIFILVFKNQKDIEIYH